MVSRRFLHFSSMLSKRKWEICFFFFASFQACLRLNVLWRELWLSRSRTETILRPLLIYMWIYVHVKINLYIFLCFFGGRGFYETFKEMFTGNYHCAMWGKYQLILGQLLFWKFFFFPNFWKFGDLSEENRTGVAGSLFLPHFLFRYSHLTGLSTKPRCVTVPAVLMNLIVSCWTSLIPITIWFVVWLGASGSISSVNCTLYTNTRLSQCGLYY